MRRNGKELLRVLLVEPGKRPRTVELPDTLEAMQRAVGGTFFLCAAPPDSDSFESLSEAQLVRYEERFHSPEVFLRLNGQIICLPEEL